MPRVTSLATQLVPIDLPSPIAPVGGTLVFRRLDNIVVHVETDGGVRGSAYVWLPGAGTGSRIDPPAIATVVEHMVHAFAPHVLGGDTADVEWIWRKMTNVAEYHGRGIVSLAHSAIDMAMWDATCKAAGASLHRMSGMPPAPVRYYSNELLDSWDASLDEFVGVAAELVAAGHRALKIPGGLHPARGAKWDVDRVASVRAAVGAEVGLMLDVGCRWRADEVVPAARRLQEIGITWLEDPYPLGRTDLLRELRRSTGIPVATGENSFDVKELARLARSGCLDVIIFEPMRVGGITGVRKLAALADDLGTPLAPHTYPDLAAQVLPSCPTGLFGEYLSWWRTSLIDPVDVVAGEGVASSRPGIGLDFHHTVLDRHEVRQSAPE